MEQSKKVIKFCMIALLASATLSCRTVPSEYGYGDPVAPLTTEERIRNAVRDAAIQSAILSGDVAVDLAASEAVYRSNPKSADAALSYATALRQSGMIGQAQLVLKPFAVAPEKLNADILVEYAKIKLESGDLEGAELFAQEALVLNDNNAASHNILGVAVDAQGYHQSAENHFRNALKHTDKNESLYVAASNNLALSLIAQKEYAEAAVILNGLQAADGIDQGVIEANENFLEELS